jgi:hypothetical protein
MTAQVPDSLAVDGEQVSLFENPLEMYFKLSGERAAFNFSSTDNTRGYIARWELHTHRLYLLGIAGNLGDGKDVILDDIFPGYPDRVFAHWFSGELRVPIGKRIHYVHAGYLSHYAAYRLISVDLGVVCADKTVSHYDYQRRYYG